MNIWKFLEPYYRKHGRKAIVAFLVYFVTKWTLTIFFGARIIAWVQDWL